MRDVQGSGRFHSGFYVGSKTDTQDSNPGIVEMSSSSCVLQSCAWLSPQKTGYMVGDSAINILVLLDPYLPFFLPLATFTLVDSVVRVLSLLFSTSVPSSEDHAKIYFSGILSVNE